MPERWRPTYDEYFGEVMERFERIRGRPLSAEEHRVAWEWFRAGMNYVRMFGSPEEGVTRPGDE
jgi:hypothetical protein